MLQVLLLPQKLGVDIQSGIASWYLEQVLLLLQKLGIHTNNRFSVDTVNLALNELLFRVNATLTQSSK